MTSALVSPMTVLTAFPSPRGADTLQGSLPAWQRLRICERAFNPSLACAPPYEGDALDSP